MGGTQNIGEASDNPVEINVTAMVDVIFCLCIFFMCSFHFKQLEGKIDTWLPNDHGPEAAVHPKRPVLGEIRLFLRWNPATGATQRQVGPLPVSSDAELLEFVRKQKGDYDRLGKLEVPILIDSTSDVPWQEVVHVVDLCKGEHLSKIEFVEPIQTALQY